MPESEQKTEAGKTTTGGASATATPPSAPAASKDAGRDEQGWASILSSIRSPLSLFALTVLVCNAVFALSAARLESLTAFVYSMHLFLGIIGTFTVIALWSPRTLYHPKDLVGVDTSLAKKQVRINVVISAILIGCLLFYAGREAFKSNANDVAIQQIAQAVKHVADTGKGGYKLECTQHAPVKDKSATENKGDNKIATATDQPVLTCNITVTMSSRPK